MRRSILAVSLAILASGCGPEHEFSVPMTEPGKVSKLVFVPSGHGSDVAVGNSIGSNGSVGITVTPIDVSIPARYGIVFECQHGTFAVEGHKWEWLWKKLKEGQRVTIRYREVYEVDSKSGSRTFAKYDFLGVESE